MGLLMRIGVVWILAGVIMTMTGCFGVGGYETYGGIRRVDSRRVVEDTIATKGSWTDSITNWLFVDSTKEK